MQVRLPEQEWDVCVLADGVSGLWLSHWLWSQKKNVLWITSEEPSSPARALLRHAWCWGADRTNAAMLTEKLQGFHTEEALPPFEIVYYDARSSRRFRNWGEVKQNWGDHEKDVLEGLGRLGKDAVDLWYWQSRLHGFHADASPATGPVVRELFREPGFYRVQNAILQELVTVGQKLTEVVLAGIDGEKSTKIRAKSFYVGESSEHLPGLVRNEAAAERLNTLYQGRSSRAGFGLHLRHKELSNALNQVAVIPLTANPPANAGMSHVVGRFVQKDGVLESFWFGLLTDEELEDNNEILKKIKLAKRAVERAIPGFQESVTHESVLLEPKMVVGDLLKSRVDTALGAPAVFDSYGLNAVLARMVGLFGGTAAEKVSAPTAATEEVKVWPEPHPT